MQPNSDLKYHVDNMLCQRSQKWETESERKQQILHMMSFPSRMDDVVSIQEDQTPGNERMKERDSQKLHWWDQVVCMYWLHVKHIAEESKSLVGIWRIARSLTLDFHATGAVLLQDMANTLTYLIICFICHYFLYWFWATLVVSEFTEIGENLGLNWHNPCRCPQLGC